MSAQQGERKQPNETSGTTNPRPVWRRAGVWVGGVVAAALATVLAGTLTQGFGWFEAVAINSQGEPVDVRVDAEARMDDVVLSPEATLSSSELDRLADMSAEEQVGGSRSTSTVRCRGRGGSRCISRATAPARSASRT